MLFLYASIWAICNRRWHLGSVLFRCAATALISHGQRKLELSLICDISRYASLALGIKMSILLFAPALAFLATVTGGIPGAVYCAATVVGVQVGADLFTFTR